MHCSLFNLNASFTVVYRTENSRRCAQIKKDAFILDNFNNYHCSLIINTY